MAPMSVSGSIWPAWRCGYLWEELLPRLDHVELAGEPKNMTANFVCGPKSVPIRFRMH